MPESFPIQVAFNGGQLGKKMAGRVDLTRYKTGCRTLKQFIPTMQGPAVKRSGTRFVKRCFSHSEKSRLIAFEYAADQSYMLEFAKNRIRFFKSGGAILNAASTISGSPTAAAPCVITTTAAHGLAVNDEIYISGSLMPFINNQFWLVSAVPTGTTFQIKYPFLLPAGSVDTTGETTGAGGSVAKIYEIVNGSGGNDIPWLSTDLDQIKVTQDADVMYITHPNYAPRKLVRTSDTSWLCTAITFAWPVFRDENTSTVTMQASAATGAGITITATAATFTSSMVGGYIKLGEIVESKHPKWRANTIDNMALEFGGAGLAVGNRVYNDGKVYELANRHGGGQTGSIAPIHDTGNELDSAAATAYEWKFVNRGYGYALITGYTSATQVTATVIVELPTSAVASATLKWALGAWSAEYGYPTSCAVFESRLWFAGSLKDPQGFWGSRTGRYENFERIPDLADSSISAVVNSPKVNRIYGMLASDGLLLFTRSGEFYATSTQADQGLTPSNIRVTQRSSYGISLYAAPRATDSTILMVHRSGKKLHELVFDTVSEKNQGVELTAASDDITGPGVLSVAVASAPYRQIFLLRTDGILVASTYSKDEDVLGWSDLTPAQASNVDGAVESVDVIPHPSGDMDQVWVTVKRVSFGTNYRYIEYFERPYDSSTQAIVDSFFVDAGVSYSGGATTDVFGVAHLGFGQTVSILADGVASTAVVAGNKLTLGASASKIAVGHILTAKLETMDFDNGQIPNSSISGMRGRVVGAVVRVDTLGGSLKYGQDLSLAMDTVSLSSFTSSTLYTGDLPYKPFPNQISRTRRVALAHSDALPCTIVAVMPRIQAEVG